MALTAGVTFGDQSRCIFSSPPASHSSQPAGESKNSMGLNRSGRSRFKGFQPFASRRNPFKNPQHHSRLVAVVQYQAGVLMIRFFGSHQEYDQIDAESV